MYCCIGKFLRTKPNMLIPLSYKSIAQDCTPMRNVHDFIIVVNCILLSAFVEWCINFKNMHGMNNVKISHISFGHWSPCLCTAHTQTCCCCRNPPPRLRTAWLLAHSTLLCRLRQPICPMYNHLGVLSQLLYRRSAAHSTALSDVILLSQWRTLQSFVIWRRVVR